MLADMVNDSRDKDAPTLPTSCTQGLISVLYKKGDREDPRNYTTARNSYRIAILDRRVLSELFWAIG
jgi:hypothetical protein